MAWIEDLAKRLGFDLGLGDEPVGWFSRLIAWMTPVQYLTFDPAKQKWALLSPKIGPSPEVRAFIVRLFDGSCLCNCAEKPSFGPALRSFLSELVSVSEAVLYIPGDYWEEKQPELNLKVDEIDTEFFPTMGFSPRISLQRP
jgi:hypothetical protein